MLHTYIYIYMNELMTSVLCSLFSTSSRLIVSCLAAPQQRHRGSANSVIAAISENLQEKRQQGFVDTVQPPSLREAFSSAKEMLSASSNHKVHCSEMERCEQNCPWGRL